MLKKQESEYIAFYILALIGYGTSLSNLTKRQLYELWSKITNAFKKQISKENFFVKGTLVEIDMPYLEESFRLAEIINYKSVIHLLRSPLFGFYNQRLIIRLTIDRENFYDLKDIRDDILRDLKDVFEDLIGAKITALKDEQLLEVKEIIYYPLIIVRNGAKLIKEEYHAAKKNLIDPIFAVPTTSLTYTLPERGRWFNLFSFKEHYIRISGRSIMVFCDGWIPLEFKQTLINAIYKGGLYEQKQKIATITNPRTEQQMHAIDDEILIKLADVIKDMVKTYIESARIAEKQRFINFFIAVLSFIISIVALIISLYKFV